MLELIYTATPKGLIQGRSGFSTVAMTQGFPPNLIPAIENMSGFRNLYMPGDAHAADNPVNCTYQQLRFGSATLLLVSRIEYAGLSYTGRSNTLAHHYIFNVNDPFLKSHAPVFLLQMAENFPPWQGEPRLLTEKASLPTANAPSDCATWKKLTGSADWGRIVAEMVRRQMSSGVILQFAPLKHSKDDLLALIAEVSAQLTPQENARFTFSTYCYQSTIGNPLFLRAYPENSSLLSSIKWMNQETVLTLGENNVIPEKYQELLLLPPPESPATDQGKNAEPPTTCRAAKVVLSTPPPVRTKASSLAPVFAQTEIAADVPAATSSSSWRQWIIAGVAVILLASLGGLFWLINTREPKSGTTASAHPVSPVAVSPSGTAAVRKEIPPAADKTEKSGKTKKAKLPPVAPAPTAKKPAASKKIAPVLKISDAEWFDFYLALHDQKKEIPLPEALRDARLEQVMLSEKRATKAEVTTSFVPENGKITIYAIKAGGADPMNPVDEPDVDHVWMTLSTDGADLIVDAPGEIDAIDKIDAIVFAIGDAKITFQNKFQESYWEIAISRVEIGKEVKVGELQATAKYPTSPYMEKQCQIHLQLAVTIDGKSDLYNWNQGKITLPQFAALNDFLRKRNKSLEAERKWKEAPAPKKPMLITDENQSDLKNIPKEDLKVLLDKYHVSLDALCECPNAENLEKLQSDIRILIYANRGKKSEAVWKKAQDNVCDDIKAYPKKCREYKDAQNEREKLDKSRKRAKSAMEDAQSKLKGYLWSNDVLEEHPDATDDELKKALLEKYQKKIQVKPVRKN